MIDDAYIPVAERIAQFREKHPDGSLQPMDPATPFRLVEGGGQTFLAYAAAAYRTPDDPRPGIGMAWEPLPGPTPFTKDSELMNAETAAWGRAIVAVLAADTNRGIATSEDVQARSNTTPPLQRSNAAERVPAVSADDSGWVWPFGKDKGKAVSEVSTKQLQWFLSRPEKPEGDKYYQQDQADRRRVRTELESRSDA
jgi:hypothetical protein